MAERNGCDMRRREKSIEPLLARRIPLVVNAGSGRSRTTARRRRAQGKCRSVGRALPTLPASALRVCVRTVAQRANGTGCRAGDVHQCYALSQLAARQLQIWFMAVQHRAPEMPAALAQAAAPRTAG